MLRNKIKYTLSFSALTAAAIFLVIAPLLAQERFIYNAHGKRDPFIPLVTPDGRMVKIESIEKNAQGLSLEGIIHDMSGISFAIVNGEIVKTGDTVGDYRVLKIEDNKVSFIQDGQVFDLMIIKEGQE